MQPFHVFLQNSPIFISKQCVLKGTAVVIDGPTPFDRSAHALFGPNCLAVV